MKADWPLHRAIKLSAISGLIAPLLLGIFISISTPNGFGTMAATMIFFVLPIFGLLIGAPLSAAIAILIYWPIYSITKNNPRMAILLLIVSGIAVGLLSAILLKNTVWLNAKSLRLYPIFTFWGALGGLLFFKGARTDVNRE